MKIMRSFNSLRYGAVCALFIGGVTGCDPGEPDLDDTASLDELEEYDLDADLDDSESDVSFRALSVPVSSVFVTNAPYGNSYGSDGEYTDSGATHNGEPVFTRQGNAGITWSLYRRAVGHWVIDFDAVDEAWSGTVAHSANQADPTEALWNGVAVLRSNTVTIAGDVAYGCTGDYTFTGTIFNDKPVYESGCAGGVFLYRRTNGFWSIWNAVDDGIHGIEPSINTEWPWSTAWPAGAVAMEFDRMDLSGDVAYGCTGEYVFNGTLMNGKPVFANGCAGGVVLYRRSIGTWSIWSSADDGIHGIEPSIDAEWPWDAPWPAGAVAIPFR